MPILEPATRPRFEYDDARKYALARMREQPRPTRWVRSDLDDEDIADAYAMACVMGCASRGAFWAWARNVGTRPA